MVQEQLESLQDETKIPKWLEEQKSSIDATFVETQRYISRILESLTKKVLLQYTFQLGEPN